ncbi:MAG: restriction endonuclease subunit S [Anaerolineae bacterium]|nr:restriction endonuclease subunit S [Anaerolineae bacterium]
MSTEEKSENATRLAVPLGEVVTHRKEFIWIDDTQEYVRCRVQGKAGLNLNNIRSLSIPVPPLSDQRRSVACLDDLQAKADILKSLQTRAATDLGALLPAILDRAFRGEL